MNQETKIQLDLLLPEGNGCEPCLERLQERIQAYRGITQAHLDQEGEPSRFCIHYDPNLVGVDYVRALAIEEGAHLAWRYHHETLSVSGLDCADCARTLETGIGRLAGVLWVSANFAASTLAVEYDAEQVDRSAILSRVRALGYDLKEPADGGSIAPSSEMVFQVDGMDCADCALHLEEALRNTPGITQARVDFALARLRVTPQDGTEMRGAIEQVAEGMGYALAVGAIFVGELSEGAVAMFLFSMGNKLEGYTMDRARNAIRG
ncbi:MAG: cation transporter [Anaerolineae bacterium]